MEMQAATLSSQLVQLATVLQSQNPSRSPVLQSTLDDLSRALVSNKALRIELGSQEPSIWVPLYKLWNNIVRAESAQVDLDGQHTQLVLGLAKFTRNLVADVPLNQKKGFPLEAQIRQLIYFHTAWTRNNQENAFIVPRVLTQTLSNLVTGNQELLDQFWGVYMVVPEEQSVLIRLLGLPDLRSVLSVLVLVVNCVHGSGERGLALVTTSTGIRVCTSILDRLEGLLDHSELEDETKVFELGYALFSKLFHFGFFPELYNRTSMDGEPVSPAQTTLLRLLDSFLHAVPTPFRDRVEYLNNLAGFLASVFFLQAKHAQRAIQQAIGEPPSPDQNAVTNIQGSTVRVARCHLDGRLPGVWVALVLLSTSLSSILLAEQEDNCGASEYPGAGVVTSSHDAVSACRSSAGTGFVEELLETLRLLDIFLPRLNFGKAKPSNSQSGESQSADATSFPYLKRDLVRLLGVLCHNCKAIQDRVRVCGGIPVVLNLCVIDERNPYLREHSLFALRNLLHNNPENQAVVDTFRVSA